MKETRYRDGMHGNGYRHRATGMVCRRCGSPVYESDNLEYAYQCFHCDEDLYSFETEEKKDGAGK